MQTALTAYDWLISTTVHPFFSFFFGSVSKENEVGATMVSVGMSHFPALRLEDTN